MMDCEPLDMLRGQAGTEHRYEFLLRSRVGATVDPPQEPSTSRPLLTQRIEDDDPFAHDSSKLGHEPLKSLVVEMMCHRDADRDVDASIAERKLGRVAHDDSSVWPEAQKPLNLAGVVVEADIAGARRKERKEIPSTTANIEHQPSRRVAQRRLQSPSGFAITQDVLKPVVETTVFEQPTGTAMRRVVRAATQEMQNTVHEGIRHGAARAVSSRRGPAQLTMTDRTNQQ